MGDDCCSSEKEACCSEEPGVCCCCGKKECTCDCCDEMMPEGYSPAAFGMVDIADEAWAELMKEKMKAEFEKRSGEKLSAAAKIVIDHVEAIWKKRMTDDDMSAMPSKEEAEEYSKKFSQVMK